MNRGIAGSATTERAGSRRKLVLTLLSSLAFLSLAAYCALGAAMITVGSAKLIPNPADNTYPESANIYSAVTAARTGHLYSPFSQPPYLLQPYGPLYYAITAAIARASHQDFDLVRTRFRLLSYACFILSALIIFLICKRLRFSIVSSILAALLFLGQPRFFTWSVTVRPDMLFLMAMLLSLLWAVQGDALGGAGYVLGGIFAGVAILIKQPGIAAPIAVLAILLFRKKPRAAAAYALSAMLPVALVFGGLLWRGGPFLEQFTGLGKGSWSSLDAAHFAFDKIQDPAILLPIAIGFIGFAQAIRAADRASQMVAAFAVANWIVGFSALPQLGGDVNYFFPGLAGCALLLPFAMQTIRRNLHSELGFAVIILALISTTWHQVGTERREFMGWFGQPEKSYVALAPFKVLSDRPFFTLHGRDPDLLDPFTNHDLELAGHWDSSPIVQNLERDDYDLVIFVDGNPWNVMNEFRGISFVSPAIVKAINENYRVFCTTPNSASAVLEPRIRRAQISSADLQSVLGQPCDTKLHGVAADLVLAPHAR